MPAPLNNWMERYQSYRRKAQIGFWFAVLALEAVFNSVVVWIDLRRRGPDFPYWQPALWELSSAVVVGLLIPAILAFERRYPLRWSTLPRNLGAHLLAGLAFCLAHVALMYGLRYPVYAMLDISYGPGSWWRELAYQYLKDVRSYASILATVLGYRLLLRLQEQARVLDAPEPAAGALPTPGPRLRPERFLVRKLRKEFLIQTLADFMEQLDPGRFVRVHRSWAVNLDRVAEIEPQDGGDARLHMKDGSLVPCSRRYRDALGTAR